MESVKRLNVIESATQPKSREWPNTARVGGIARVGGMARIGEMVVHGGSQWKGWNDQPLLFDCGHSGWCLPGFGQSGGQHG